MQRHCAESQSEVPGSHHPHVQLCPLAAGMHRRYLDVMDSRNHCHKTKCLKALPLRVLGQSCPAVMTQHWTHQCSAWHCRRVRQCGLSRPSLSLYGRCTVTTVDSGTPPRAGRTHATSFPRGTQLCQAQHGRLLVSPGWASSEEHGDGEPARGQRGPKLRSIVIRAAY